MCFRFASDMIYYGLSLGASTLAGNRYVNFFLSGAVEAPAYLLTVFVLQKSVSTSLSVRTAAVLGIYGLGFPPVLLSRT